MATVGHSLAAEAEHIRSRVRDRFGAFLRDQVNPGAVDRDRTCQPVPDPLLVEAARIGLLGFELPSELGGGGEDAFAWGILLDELGDLCHDYSFVTLVSTRAALARSIYELGSPVQIERYAAPMVRGTRRGAFCYTDGGDAFSLRTRAARVGDEIEITGEKHVVTGATTADTFVTYARDEHDDVVVVAVERTDRGVAVEPGQFMGCRASGLGSVTFDRVRVPASRILVERDGISHAQRFLNRRAVLACPALGAARAVFRDCITTLTATVRYGQPLATLNNVLSALGRMQIDLDASAAVMLHSLDAMRRSETRAAFDAQTAVAKHFVTERALGVLRSAMDLLGAHGYRSGSRVERHFRDIAGLIAGGGTQDTLLVNLGGLAVAAGSTRSRA